MTQEPKAAPGDDTREPSPDAVRPDKASSEPTTPEHQGRGSVFHTGGLGVSKESAVMLGVLPLGDPRREQEDPLSELERLAETAGLEVRGRVVQKVTRPVAATYAGSGTVERVAQLAGDTGADTVLCDNDLSPAQLRNLERLCKRKVVDRTDLILDIFARHARTNQAMLQVELAQLEYARPRLRKMWGHLEGEQGGVGFRGPGEKQLEMDKRMLGKRIRDLKRQLDQIRERKERQVSTRSDIHTVALVGYTNAGKSTLFGRLTESEPYIADRLFATLDTRTRPFQVRTRVKAVLSDTVGFIDHLPHRLVESFHATLEEVLQADLLVHVVDAAGEDPLRHVESVNEVLSKIGCTDRPTITALNKIDAADRSLLPFLRKRLPNPIGISARSGEGLEELRDKVAAMLTEDEIRVELFVPYSEGRFIAAVDAIASELEKHPEGERLRLVARVSREGLGKLKRLIEDRSGVEVRRL